MPTQLSHQTARALFVDLADQTLGAEERRRVEAHLEHCADCATGWQRYAATVRTLRKVEREKAPPTLATGVMRRIRRSRPRGLRAPHHVLVSYSVPIEAAVPLLLGLAAAAFLVLAAL
ncbi:MAG: zf-HC2 domain-containing protein [Myxococcaceae bacterium]|nr:zf-HC2 domain-containing protein [Myxococcaceae bacterium]MCI0671793.1 zf-HC2 domain-containing protein [Myxococcaceae bacterium]